MLGLIVLAIMLIHTYRSEDDNKLPKIIMSILCAAGVWALCLVVVIVSEANTLPGQGTRVVLSAEEIIPVPVEKQAYNLVSDKNGNIFYYIYYKETANGKLKAAHVPDKNIIFTDEENTKLIKTTVTRKTWVKVLTLCDCNDTVWSAEIHVDNKSDIKANTGGSWAEHAKEEIEKIQGDYDYK